MPDVFTEHPEVARDLLLEAGFTCGVEPRILEGRDPEWTCIIDGKDIGGDLYIHHLDRAPGDGLPAWTVVVFVVLLVVVALQTWTTIRLRRRVRPQPS